MAISVELYGWLREAVQAGGEPGVLGEEAEGLSVAELVMKLLNRSKGSMGEMVDAETGEIKGGIWIVLNERLLEFKEAEKTMLKEGDRLLLMPPYVGG